MLHLIGYGILIPLYYGKKVWKNLANKIAIAIKDTREGLAYACKAIRSA